MTMQVFEFFRSGVEAPITIFAAGLAEAEQIFDRWVQTHDPDVLGMPPSIYPFGDDWLDRRLTLKAAAKQGKNGVGYWSERGFRWVVERPEMTSMLPLTPPQGSVHLFRVEDEAGETAMVFAKSNEEAFTLYCAWHLDRWGSPPERYTGRKQSRWELRGDMAVLRDQLEAGITGVAHWDMVEGWQVLPPDWEPSYGL